MKRNLITGTVLTIICSAALTLASQLGLKGDYVEARTASVMAGACHYNGELVTAGREAVMAWNIRSGKVNGTSMAGVRVVAITTADTNLSDSQAVRQSEIIVDSAATDSQAATLVEAFKSKYAASLGKVISVRRADISFRHEGEAYTIEVPGFAGLSIKAMPDNECCKMPHMVWYSPLVPIHNRKVGYTKRAFYEGGQIGDPWQRSGENSAFYGSFSL